MMHDIVYVYCRTHLISICMGSTLDYPRIHFRGRYYANVNTVNNFESNYKLTLPEDEISHGWNPTGGNEWSLQDCFVTSVVYSNGTISTDPNREPLIGAVVDTNPFSVEAKLSCFDVAAQNKSALYGATVGVKQNKYSNEYGFLASWLNRSIYHQNEWFQTSCLTSRTVRSYNHYNGARSAGTLTNVTWAPTLRLELLQQLKKISERRRGQLSISFAMYEFTIETTLGNYTHGKISGTISYAKPTEPRFFEGERLLSFQFVEQPNLNLTLSKNDSCYGKEYVPLWAYKAPFKVHPQRKTLTVDFSSSFTRNNLFEIRDLGTLYLGVLGTMRRKTLCVDTISSVDYQKDTCRNINGCIMDFKLNNYLFNLIQNHRLVLVKPTKGFAPTNTTFPSCPTRLGDGIMFNQIFHHDEQSMTALLLEEWYYIRPHSYYTFAMEKGDIEVVDLFVTILGQPAFGTTIELKPPEVRLPTNGSSFTHEATVDRYGYARFLFRANSITWFPREEYDLDGQVYYFIYSVKGEPRFCFGDKYQPFGSEKYTCTEMITIKVYSDISINQSHVKQYTWVDHIHPIFFQYSRLYPTMQMAFNLSNYDFMIQPYVINLLNYSLQLDINDPNYMPASRDLSKAKTKMILEWLTKPCYSSTHCFINSWDSGITEISNSSMSPYVSKSVAKSLMCSSISSFKDEPQDIGNYFKSTAKINANDQQVDCIKELNQSVCSIYMLQYCLQKAIELEFYTIPLYLTALYSIKSGYNMEVQKIIRSIVMQEMLHMLQASNILISIGGTPIIDSASTAPAYPATGLPGGVFPHLTVSLRKASIDQIYSVFMAIEYPHKVVDTELDINKTYTRTIGQFYTAIKNCLIFHGDAIFYPNRTSLQVKWPWINDYGHIFVVRDLDSAIKGITEITEQGEGAQPGVPFSNNRDRLAHFFKFQEIACQRALVFQGISNYSYTGHMIPFDDSGVWPMRDNPSVLQLPTQTPAYARSKIFHETYRSLLWKLDDVMRRHPQDIKEAIPLMASLEFQALTLMCLPFNVSDINGETCGPVFDYYWIYDY